ncbi:MAG: VWA domain-containing protein [Polyangiaceae bacterium]|nr:VWA domain-containing protein [Polyangiaceae bacterium]
MRRRGFSIVLVLFGLCLLHCGNSDGDGENDGTAGSGGYVFATGSRPGFTENGFVFHTDENGMCQIERTDSACTGEAFEKEDIPVDIYVMFDRSGSMCRCIDPPRPDDQCNVAGCVETRLAAITRAFREFLADPESAGLSVGIGSFGQLPFGETSCDPGAYATPNVSIGELPGNTQALMNELESAEPGAETPTGAAIRAACSTAQARKEDVPGHEVVILLLTDGEPHAPVTCHDDVGPCCPTLEDAVAAAEECAKSDPAIKTYVLGVGPFLSNLGRIAVAGGTKDAHLVEGDDVAASVLAALREIRGDAQIPCQMSLPRPPSGSELNFDQLNMAFVNDACEGRVLYNVISADRCDDEVGGWYYDNLEEPTGIELCPSSCEEVSSSAQELAYTLDCGTLYIPR